MDKKPRDVYRVESGHGLSEEACRVLSQLYLPLIGENAYVLYMVLVSEGSGVHMQMSHQRLLSLMNLDIVSLEHAFVKLEEYMLVRTYVKEGENRNAYVYVLNEPLRYADFLENRIYMSRYLQIMGRRDTEETVSRLQAGTVSLDGYKDITTPVVNTRMNEGVQEQIVYKKVKPQYQFSDDDSSIHFDYEHFLATTSTLVFPGELRTGHNMSLIGRLATVYGLSADRMRILTAACVNIDTMTFDEDKLKIMAERSQPDVKNPKDPYALSPVSFLQSKQNGAQVSRTDKRILEHLSLDMHFPNEVINVMMEYILKVSDNRINEKFVDMVAGEWARSGIHTKQQAMMQAKKDLAVNRSHKKQFVHIEKPVYEKETQEDDRKASKEQIEALRRKQMEIKK